MQKKTKRAPDPPWPEKLKVWVRHGGRCVFCNRYLLESDLTLRPVPLGELAHNNAASDAGPRADPGLSAADRNNAENLLLLCGAHHPDVDKPTQLDIFTVDQLVLIKREHEARIRLATDRVGSQRTAVLRVQGNVRGASVDIGSERAMEAVIRSASRFPDLPFSYGGGGVEIDLRNIPGEEKASDLYYEAAAARIDEIIDGRLKPAIEKGAIDHLSIFGFARLPLLVHLGARLDDTIPTDLYQRHRGTQSWIWPADEDGDPRFEHRIAVDRGANASATEAALIVNASGTIHLHELPSGTTGLLTFVIEPTGHTANPDTVRSRSVLGSFERAFREVLARIESEAKMVKLLHVFAAAPVSVAVTIGRAVGWGIHPALVVYDRSDDGTYVPSLEEDAK